MISPIAPHRRMEQVILEEGLTAYRCKDSGGVYLSAESYWRWLHKQPQRLPHLPAPAQDAPPSEEMPAPKRCPETGTLMLRFRVGHGFPFSIERSVTGGIWLDAGEWEALRSRNFHAELHLVFTAPWQSAVRRERAREVETAVLEERLGSSLLADLDALRDRLADHPHRDSAIAYLLRRTSGGDEPTVSEV